MTAYREQIRELRKIIIADILSLMKENNLTEIDISELVAEPAWVIWFDGYGVPSECRITTVSAEDGFIILKGFDHDNEVERELDSRHDLGARNVDWLAQVHDNIRETLAMTQR